MSKLFPILLITIASLFSIPTQITSSRVRNGVMDVSQKTDANSSLWVSDRRLTRTDGESRTSINFARSISADGAGRVHIVWREQSADGPAIFYKRSPDGGISWGPAIRLSSADGISETGNPGITTSANFVHVVWWDMRTGAPQVFYKRSQDGGLTWSADMQISNSPVHATYPSIAAQGDSVYVVYGDTRDGNAEVYYLRSTDAGSTWSTPVRLSATPHSSYTPTIAVSASNVYVAWTDTRDFGQPSTLEEEYFRRSTDGGTTFEPEQRLTIDPPESPANSWAPSLVARDQYVWISWFDARDGNFEIYTKRSTDGGISWSSDTRLTRTAGQSVRPSIALRGQQLYISYWDSDPGNEEVFVVRSDDLGVTWADPERLTFNEGSSSYPSCAASNTGIHIVWTDNRDGNSELYYKRFPGSAVAVGNGRIAFVRGAQGAGQIYTMNPDGSDVRKLTVEGENTYPAWSKDGTKLAFTSTRSGSPEIWMMNPDGSEPVQVTFGSTGGAFTPDWSYDGTRIAYNYIDPMVFGPEVWVMNVEGTDQRRLTNTPQSPNGPTWSLLPSWQPDDGAIYYASTASGSSQIWGMLPDGQGKEQKTNGLGAGYPDANAPQFNRSGILAFWSGLENQFGEVWKVQISLPDGPKRLTETRDPMNSDNPAWSPDGTKILFDSNREGNQTSIWIMNADGSQPGALIPNASGRAAWQPVFSTNANVSGRVTRADGRGIYPSATVAMTDIQGNVRYAATNPFGYYRFFGVATGQSYKITVRSKRYSFAPRTINVRGDLTDLDLVAEP